MVWVTTLSALPAVEALRSGRAFAFAGSDQVEVSKADLPGPLTLNTSTMAEREDKNKGNTQGGAQGNTGNTPGSKQGMNPGSTQQVGAQGERNSGGTQGERAQGGAQGDRTQGSQGGTQGGMRSGGGQGDSQSGKESGNQQGGRMSGQRSDVDSLGTCLLYTSPSPRD